MKKILLAISLFAISLTLKAQTNLVFSSTSVQTPSGVFPLANVYTSNADTVAFNLWLIGKSTAPIYGGITRFNTTINGTTYTSFSAMINAVKAYIGTASSGGGGGGGGSVTVTSSVLPTGASTSANQSTEISGLNQIHSDLIAPLPTGSNTIGKTINLDAAGNSITSTLINSKQRLDVSLATGNTPGSAAVSYMDQVGGIDNSGNSQVLQLDASKNLKISDGSGLLSTSALQTSANSSLSTIATNTGRIPSLGQQLSSSSTSTVVASDQPVIPVTASFPGIVNYPATSSIAALNGTVQWTAQSGGGYLLTLTNGPAATTAWSGTITFQYSLNNSTWNTLTVVPLSTPAASVTTTTANGLWFVPPIVATGTSSQLIYIRVNMTAYTSGTVYASLANADKPNSKVLLPWTYTVTSGQNVLNAIDASGVQSISVQISAITTTVLTAQGSNDPTFATYVALPAIIPTTQSASVGTMSTAATYRFSPQGYKYVRIQVSTTGTVLSIQGITATLGQDILTQSFGNDIGVNVNGGTLPTVTTVTTVTTLANGQTAAGSASTGSPVRIGGRVVPTTIATIPVAAAAGQAYDYPISTNQQVIDKLNATAELDYTFLFSTVGTTVTPQTLVQAPGTASVRNYVSSIRISTDALGTAGVVWVLDAPLTVSSIAITTGLVTTSTTHDLKVGDAFVFTALAAGTGVSTNTLYYVTSVGSTTTFNFALTPGGSNVIPSVAYTGTTGYRILDQIRLQTTALTPTVIDYKEPIRSNLNNSLNFLIPTTLTSGNIYLTINGFRGF